jgi:hypothetical protein
MLEIMMQFPIIELHPDMDQDIHYTKTIRPEYLIGIFDGPSMVKDYMTLTLTGPWTSCPKAYQLTAPSTPYPYTGIQVIHPAPRTWKYF